MDWPTALGWVPPLGEWLLDKRLGDRGVLDL